MKKMRWRIEKMQQRGSESSEIMFNLIRKKLEAEDFLEASWNEVLVEHYFSQYVSEQKISQLKFPADSVSRYIKEVKKFLQLFDLRKFVATIILDLSFYLASKYSSKSVQEEKLWRDIWKELMENWWKKSFWSYDGQSFFEVCNRIEQNDFLQLVVEILRLAANKDLYENDVRAFELKLYEVRLNFPLNLSDKEIQILHDILVFQTDSPTMLSRLTSNSESKISSIVNYLRDDLQLYTKNVVINFEKIGLTTVQILVQYKSIPQDFIQKYVLNSPWLYSYLSSPLSSTHLYNFVVPKTETALALLRALKRRFLQEESVASVFFTIRKKNSFHRYYNTKLLKVAYKVKEVRRELFHNLKRKLNSLLPQINAFNETAQALPIHEFSEYWEAEDLQIEDIRDMDFKIINELFLHGYHSYKFLRDHVRKKMETVRKRVIWLLENQIIRYNYLLYPYNLVETLLAVFQCTTRCANELRKFFKNLFVTYYQEVCGDLEGVMVFLSLPRGWAIPLAEILSEIPLERKWLISMTTSQIAYHWQIPYDAWNPLEKEWKIYAEDFGLEDEIEHLIDQDASQ